MEQNSKHKYADCKSSREKIWHRKILWSENADFKFNGSNEEGDDSNKQWSRDTAEKTWSLKEFWMLKYF